MVMEAAVSVPAARVESTPCVVCLSFIFVFLEVVPTCVKIAQYTPSIRQKHPQLGKVLSTFVLSPHRPVPHVRHHNVNNRSVGVKMLHELNIPVARVQW